MAIEWTQAEVVDLIAPELAAVSAPVFEQFAEFAAGNLSSRVFPVGSVRRKWGGMYLTAHLLSLTAPAGVTPRTSSAIASESAGGVSVSYAVPSGVNRGDFGRTPYGERFASLLRVGACGGFVP